ncbi:excalibur calcium-binding domain-containing protein [Corynebacterium macclintockiae]|uniref:excalibur calcium-binding domain-containing protein n=1 Tax=Corynebacterium macclintockiae TaxID=2913501 RepID=UPI003EB73219
MSVQKRTTKTGKPRWVARYRDKTGREHSRSFDTQREAKQHIADQQVALAPAQYFSNCSEAKRAGAAPLYAGSPGYRSGLDRDGDGVACEKSNTRQTKSAPASHRESAQ